MVRMRTSVTLVALLIASQAAAQPGPSAPPPPPPPPPAPAPSPTPAPPPPPTPAPAVAPQAPQAPQDPYAPDPVLNEQIAEQLVSRAQELLDAKIYVDAKQLAVEALVKSPKGNSADRARFIIRLVNNALGIKDDPAPVPPSEVKPEEHVDLTPMGDPTAPLDPAKDPPPGPADTTVHDGRIAGMAHGAFYGGVIGATVGAFIGQDNPAKVAVPVGIVAGVGTGLVAPLVVKKLQWDEAQVRTAGSFNAWGGVIGGMFGDAVTGAGDTDSPTAKGILLGASIGSTIGLAGGVAFARNKKFTRGDVALIDTMAGIGTVGGLTMGMLMQPAQPEAYAVNSILGAAGGIVIGIVAAPNTNTTPRRMLRVAGLSALGGAVPFLLYAAIADSNKSGDEQLVGFLSSAGLVGGAYLGFRLTSGMDAGLDVQDGKKGTSDSDAPPAAVSRNSDGSWTVGAIGMQPLSKQLSNGAKGVTFTLLGATF